MEISIINIKLNKNKFCNWINRIYSLSKYIELFNMLWANAAATTYY